MTESTQAATLSCRMGAVGFKGRIPFWSEADEVSERDLDWALDMVPPEEFRRLQDVLSDGAVLKVVKYGPLNNEDVEYEINENQEQITIAVRHERDGTPFITPGMITAQLELRKHILSGRLGKHPSRGDMVMFDGEEYFTPKTRLELLEAPWSKEILVASFRVQAVYVKNNRTTGLKMYNKLIRRERRRKYLPGVFLGVLLLDSILFHR